MLLEKLIVIVEEDTDNRRSMLRHTNFVPEEIINNMNNLKAQVRYIMREMENVYRDLEIDRPAYPQQIEYHEHLNYNTINLLIYKELMELCDEILRVISNGT